MLISFFMFHLIVRLSPAYRGTISRVCSGLAFTELTEPPLSPLARWYEGVTTGTWAPFDADLGPPASILGAPPVWFGRN